MDYFLSVEIKIKQVFLFKSFFCLWAYAATIYFTHFSSCYFWKPNCSYIIAVQFVQIDYSTCFRSILVSNKL
jgi:hypothetical protein